MGKRLEPSFIFALFSLPQYLDPLTQHEISRPWMKIKNQNMLVTQNVVLSMMTEVAAQVFCIIWITIISSMVGEVVGNRSFISPRLVTTCVIPTRTFHATISTVKRRPMVAIMSLRRMMMMTMMWNHMGSQVVDGITVMMKMALSLQY